MKTFDQPLLNFEPIYPVAKLAPVEETLFLDIETTGFTARSSYLYLIGCVYYKDNCWNTIQWFAENYTEESALLEAFFAFATSYKYLVHFNGNNFDLPYLLQKCLQLGLPYSFEDFEGIDIYRRIAPYKYFLKLSNCKQKTLEQFIGISREDKYSGGDLINIYHDYVRRATPEAEHDLILHNADDLKGMLEILPILSYYDLFHETLRVKKVQANSYKDINGIIKKELLISFVLPTAFPRQISVFSNGCFFRGEEGTGTLKVPIFEEELKYFYANYKDYYYLPEEDVALHKSVASFVDKDHRIQANASNCYTRKIGSYLPQWDIVFEPFFKRDYKSQELYFEITDEMKTDRETFNHYTSYVLQIMATTF